MLYAFFWVITRRLDAG